MLRKILQIQLVLAELLDSEEDESPVQMAQRVALLFRDKQVREKERESVCVCRELFCSGISCSQSATESE